jgi:uncharacterized protein with HEPN domain
MAKDDLVYIGHMLDMAEKALNLAQGKSRADFDSDEALALGLTYLVQVIGEAARRVGPDFTAAHPEVPWRAIIGMRTQLFTNTCTWIATSFGMSSQGSLCRLSKY